MKFLRVIDRLYNKKISSKGLAIFRICFALNLFFEANRIFRYRHLYFDTIPFIEVSNINYTIPLIVWILVLLQLVFGLFTRINAIVNYVFVLWIFNSVGSFEYHMDYTYLGISFLMMLIPLSQSFSLDNLIKKIKYSNTKFLFKPKQKTTVLYYFLIVFFGIALVYFDSVFHKLKSDIWLTGLGMWLPASIPQVTIFNNQWLLNQEYLIKALGYFTFAFEIVFCFLFFIKKFRSLLLLIGLGLHIGILLEFPIPYFALGAISIYVLMVPVGFWDKIQNKLKTKSNKLIFYYDKECPLCIRTKIFIKHFDVFNNVDFKSVQEFANRTDKLNGVSVTELRNKVYSRTNKGTIFYGINTYKKVSTLIPVFYPVAILFYIPGISFLANNVYNKIIKKNRNVECSTEKKCDFQNQKLKKIRITNDDNVLGSNFKVKKAIKMLIIFLCLLQFNSTFNFPLSDGIVKEITINHKFTKRHIQKLLKIKKNARTFSRIFFGITAHGVFVDSHFRGYTKTFSIKYNGELLPIYNELGMPDEYLLGGSWVNFTFMVNRPNVLNYFSDLKKGLIRYTAFWAHENKINLDNVEFKIVMKKNDVVFEWKKNLLKNNLTTPWEEVGTMVWKENKAIVDFAILKK